MPAPTPTPPPAPRRSSTQKSTSLLVPIRDDDLGGGDDQQPRRRAPIRSSSLASELGILPAPSVAASLAPPPDDPLQLTPLRAHYLKRELVTLEFVKELQQLDSPGALSVLGPPFLPKSRFVNGLPQPAPALGSDAARNEEREWEAQVDLPFLRFVFHHFVLSFPFLVACPPTFFSHKLQPFVYSFVSRNISASDDRESDTKRRRVAGKVEKHLGLVMSAAIKLSENGGREEVVRIEDDGTMHTGAPATQEQATANVPNAGLVMMKKRGALTTVERHDEVFSINVVSVRTATTKSRMRTKKHEEFIVRTRRKGIEDVYVARRYGEFVRLAETVRSLSSARSTNTGATRLTRRGPSSSEKNASKRVSRTRRQRIAALSTCVLAPRPKRHLDRAPTAARTLLRARLRHSTRSTSRPSLASGTG